ncbi:uncharacterized protein METZ01_LOCUS165175 [marine metagenome]|jgi:hypothetical protein|uniref:Uncharacterized protein n=1 Tax=marine metagenome TaxID=408172 RepID=A0A382BFQ4_9ZZZZ|tara:strand:- start:551 stop:769 length:219 start_codon:yes stop_codon:yes gene_type:complete
MSIEDEEWYGTSVHHFNEEQSLDKILELTKEALELAREKDEPRDMQMRFLLSMAVDKLESFRYENPDYITSF